MLGSHNVTRIVTRANYVDLHALSCYARSTIMLWNEDCIIILSGALALQSSCKGRDRGLGRPAGQRTFLDVIGDSVFDYQAN